VVNQSLASRRDNLGGKFRWMPDHDGFTGQLWVTARYEDVEALGCSLVKSPILQTLPYSYPCNLLPSSGQSCSFAILE